MGAQAKADPPGEALIAHPRYPGYGYFLSDPTRWYQLPQPVSSPRPGPSGPAPAGSFGGSTPAAGAGATLALAFVEIVNAGPEGTAVEYVIDGVAYKAVRGQHERRAVGSASIIRYDRGGAFGVKRYALSAGVYEFRPSDTGWALVKIRPTP